jgi:ArsR family transcriptional regulator, arsenate/arsenite/antimonite-responsive transcriptional repressor / arsenate reductase (thioredoxin)
MAGGPKFIPTENVVFVCTANSARSQLAAALWNRVQLVPALSAGTIPQRGSIPRRWWPGRRQASI